MYDSVGVRVDSKGATVAVSVVHPQKCQNIKLFVLVRGENVQTRSKNVDPSLTTRFEFDLLSEEFQVTWCYLC